MDDSQCVDELKVHFNGPFIEAIKSGDDVTVGRMLADGLIYTDQCCHNVISTALTLAVKSKSFNTVALLVERGATISNNEVRLLLEKHSQESWCKPIARLLDLEKNKQIAIINAFCDANGDLDLCRERINEINRVYKDDVAALKKAQVSGIRHVPSSNQVSATSHIASITSGEVQPQSNAVAPKFDTLLSKIRMLAEYGHKIIHNTRKADNTIMLAKNLEKVVLRLNAGEIDQQKASKEIANLIRQGHKTLGEDRNISDIIAHICLALTGVGLVIMGINKLRYGSFFLNSTKRQTMLDEIEQDEALVSLGAG